MMDSMISVVVCTYNQQDTIGRTLDAILSQQCHVPIEVIIGEDHSTDRTPDICRQYAQRHPGTIRLMANARNKGVQDNYFDCLLAARGTYIADCAGDDFWTDPLKLEKQVTLMEQHPEVSMVLTRWNSYDEQTRRVTPGPKPPFGDAIVDGQRLLVPIVTQTDMSVFHLCTALYRTDVFHKAYEADTLLFRNPEFGVEDTQVALAMALGGSIAYLPDVTLNYSSGHPSASRQQDDRRQYRFVKGITALTRYITDHYPVKGPAVERLLSRRLFAMAMHAFRAHSPQMAQETASMQREWHVPMTLPLAVVRFVMCHPLLWQLALRLRQVFISLKALIKQRKNL